jgi:formate-dependent nitrite reductase membrane component NrfD
VLRKLEQLECIALLVEMASLFAFLRGAGRAARPLVGTAPREHGRTFWVFVFGGGLVLPWLLQTGSLLGGRSGKGHGGRGLVLALLVLLGGYVLRRTIIEAGQTSSQDARTTLWHAQSPRDGASR